VGRPRVPNAADILAELRRSYIVLDHADDDMVCVLDPITGLHCAVDLVGCVRILGDAEPLLNGVIAAIEYVLGETA
jgi:hypothetical protein